MSDREDLLEEENKEAWFEDLDADPSPEEKVTPPAAKGRKSANGAAGKRPKFDFSASRQFVSWMDEQNLSLGFTTYQAGKLFLIGRRSGGRLSMFQRSFGRCMGLWTDGQTMWLSTLYQLWRFENRLPPGRTQDGFDRMFVPQTGFTTGDIDTHDLAINGDGKLVFVNTLFSCLATLSDRHSFRPLWRPPFVSKLAAEDRCHLNGLAMDKGRARFVTAISQTDATDSWRDRRHDGGCVIDVASDEIVVSGLSMPHSPRFYRDRLWVHNSGTGYFGYVDIDAGKFEPVTFCPGYLRGMAFHGDFAIVGLSKPRERSFSGLALDGNLAEKDAEPRCGLMVIDLRSGDIVHYIRFEGSVSELYDVVVFPGARRPMAIGFQTDEIRRAISAERSAPPADAPKQLEAGDAIS